MLIKNIVALVNAALAGEQCTYAELKPFLDKAVDEINTQLNAKYPVFSELGGYDVDYNMLPDKYIRTVVVVGAAWYYYTADEEGAPAAQQYALEFQRGMFYMTRDMLYSIPVEYQADDHQGMVQFDFNAQQGISLPYGIGEW